MPKFCRVFIALLCLVSAGLAEPNSESEKKYRYFFYRATKGDVRLYLLGSMHMGKPEDPDYPEKIYQALVGSRMFILEGEVRREKIRTPDLKYTYLPDGTTIQKLLSRKEIFQLEKIGKTLGLRISLFERFQPWFMEFMFGYRLAFNQGFVLEYGTEHRLIRYMQQKMPAKEQPRIFALEASDEVLRRMHALPIVDQLARFRAFLTYSEKSGESNALEMRQYWREGNDDKVKKIFSYYANEATSDGNRFARVLLYDRNKRMAERLGLVARYPGQYFVVTGALHLIGEKSILAYLTEAGFTVERL
jgi:uncharacterized protein YbaP (TraB family)